MNERSKIATKSPNSRKEKLVSQSNKTELSQHINSPIDHILYLQRTVGNQAVQRMMKSGVLQTKLNIGQPGDKYEQEADRVAEQVMRMPEPHGQRQPKEEEEEESIQSKPLAAQITPLVQRQAEEEEKEEEEPIQTKALSEQITPLVQRQEEEEEEIQTKPTNINAIKGGGRPLPQQARNFFESRFGANFRSVRVHTGAHAAETARSINARAFTVGRNITFGAGQYAPESNAGKNLIAHELTHVIQQGFTKSDLVSDPNKKRRVYRNKIPVRLQRSPGNEERVFEEIQYEVPSIARHRYGRGCWAYTATAMKSWKDGKTYTIEEVLKQIDSIIEEKQHRRRKAAKPGEKVERLFVTKYWNKFQISKGLKLDEMDEFLGALDLKRTSLKDCTLWEIRELLEEHGPLWVVEDRDKDPNSVLHAIVITGIKGDGTVDGTLLKIIDPASRKPERGETFREFIEKYEAVEETLKFECVPLPMQVAHF
jgi:hypothetical protein